jgi:TldD protein
VSSIVPWSEFLAGQRELLAAVVRRLAGEYGYVSLLATDCGGLRYQVQRRQTAIQDSRFAERGCVVRLYHEQGYFEHSFNELPDPGGPVEEAAGLLAAEIRRRAQAAQARRSQLPPSRPYPRPGEESAWGRWQREVSRLPEDTGPEEIVRRLTALRDRAFQLSAGLVDMRVIYESVRVCKLFLSPQRQLEQAYQWSQGYLAPLVRRGEVTRLLFRSFSGLEGTELIERMGPEVADTVRLAEALLEARKVEPGQYEVILAPDVAGLVAHESFGHGVELDMFVKKRAKAQEYLGRPVGSPGVSLHDGAAAAAEVSSYHFDDEGTTGTDTLVIDRGVFRTGISDLLSAQALGLPPTGNGKRESFERKAYARMTNTFFTPGPDRLEEMIASIRHGYLLEKFMSGMEDPKNWGIQGVIFYGREIRDGRLSGVLVAPVIITGYVPDVLGAVSMVSSDFALSGSGMCGKGHKEYVKTSTGGPYMKTVMRLG